MGLIFDKNAPPNREFTFVLIHANGTPRTYRFSLPTLRNMLLTFASVLVLLLALLFLSSFTSWHLWRESKKVSLAGSPAPAESENLPSDTNTESPPPENFANLPQGLVPAGVPGLFLNNPAVLAQQDVKIRVVNPRAQIDLEKGIANFQFDISHINPDGGEAVRGFIVVILRSAGGLFAYPSGLFNPREGSILNYTRGETFGVSRYRQVVADFKNLPKTLVQPTFQILLFSHDGKIILSSHYAEKSVGK